MIHPFSCLRTALCLLFLVVGGLAFSQTNALRTENGLVSGTQSTDGRLGIYKGIPFAAPPVGELRWKAPQPAANWEGVRDCSAFPASAVQPPPVPFFVWSQEFLAPPAPLSEDCLYLNVWGPAKPAGQKRPVIVWIHGGGFTSGAGSCPIYDGEGLAKKGVVVVTINYRLGVFGFLAHPELSLESGNASSGNYAFLDQIAALQWVKNNIAAFGGDPNRVTIAGQSAGAFAVNALMASPLAKGLFHRAIAESGGMFASERLKTLPEASLQGINLVKKLGKNSVAQLRLLPADSLLKAGAAFNSPVLDGYVLPADVHSIFSQSKQNDVPLLTGWNRDEGFLFGEPLSADAFKAQAKARYGNLSDQFLLAFPASTDSEAKISQKNLSRDQLFAWQTYTWARLQSTTGKSKAWLYRFDRVPPGRPDLAEHGAFHSAEIAYALNTLNRWDRPWTPVDQRISSLMSDYWVNFADKGNPNGEDLPTWAAFDPAMPAALVFDAQVRPEKHPLQPEFGFLDEWHAATAPDLSKYQKSFFGTDSLPYRILFPENYDPAKKYPLVLFLHGSGERGNDNQAQLTHGAKLFLKNEFRSAYPCIAVFPQCPSDQSWNTAKADRSQNPPVRSFDYSAPISQPLLHAIELTQHLIATEGVDGQRVYIAGLSMGGMGTFEAVARYPGLFAAAAPICGGGDAQGFDGKKAKTPMHIFHGNADSVVDAKYSREMHDRLKALGFDVSYTEYPAVNHNSWDFAFAEPDFLAWLFSKKRG